MQIVTTEAMYAKYSINKDQLTALLTPISPNIHILPVANNYMPIKVVTDTFQDEVLLVGGHDVVPFAILQNPCSDPDASVYSDAPYASTEDPLFYIPNKVVGRLPDESNNAGLDFLQTVINNQVAHMNAKPGTVGWFNFVASVWSGISTFMNNHFQMNAQTVAPPNCDPDGALIGKKYHYVNLHDAQASPNYYGQGMQGYPIALTPKVGHFKDGIVSIEACYGGWLQGRNRNTSIPLMALYSGAVGIACSTAIAYGPATEPMDGIDALSYFFFTELLSGKSVGQAFINAKLDFMTYTIKSQGNIAPSNKKGLLEYNLYGTPTIVV